jgi:hypothetical protein
MHSIFISILGQAQASIRATKAETISKSHLYVVLLCVLGHVIAVKVLWRIAWLVQVKSWRQYTLR